VTRKLDSAPWLVAFAACAAFFAAAVATVRAAPTKSRCTKTTSPGRNLQRFVDTLPAGAVGCLTAGTYDVTRLVVRTRGRAGVTRTLRSSDPHRRATIKGSVWVAKSASYWTLEDLNFDGRNARNLPSPIVNGDHTTWRRVEITNHHAGDGGTSGGICFVLGDTSRWGIPHDTAIVQSRIHDCGVSDNGNHGIYIEATGGDTLIANNWIYRNGDRGIQLFPDAAHVLIVHNVIDGNGSGVIFSGTGPYASHHNVVSGNIISNSQNRWNVESWYPNGVGGAVGNVVAGNCFWASNVTPRYDHDGGVAPPDGFTVGSNVVEHPLYLARQRNDLRLTSGSGCSGYGPRRGRAPLW
jgi:parallel beta-helix repeat protein